MNVYTLAYKHVSVMVQNKTNNSTSLASEGMIM